MDESKLTTEELYGKSDTPSKPLVYEETPIINPVQPPRIQPKSNILGKFVTIVFFILLFALGVWLSTMIRQFLPTSAPSESIPTPNPVAIAVSVVTPTVSNDPYVSWKSYTIDAVSYRLPAESLAPICDGANCISQGTYLQGGTRFTVATHENARQFSSGAVIVDAGGREFTTTETTIAGRRTFSYQGVFTGTTTGGYSFSQMRGVMILLNDTQTLEMNHFTPNGVSADFASDDSLFDKILESLSLTPI